MEINSFLKKRISDLNKIFEDQNLKIKNLNLEINKTMADLNVLIGHKSECEFLLKEIQNLNNENEKVTINGKECNVINKEAYSIEDLNNLIKSS